MSTVYQFFDLMQGFLLNYRDIPHGCFLVCELLCFGQWWWSLQYRSDGNQNDTAGKSYHTRLYCLTNILIFFTLYFVYIASNFKELLGNRSHRTWSFFLYLLSMKEDKQTEKFWSIFVWDNIYTTIDTILCLVLIRWKIFQGIYKKLTSRDI